MSSSDLFLIKQEGEWFYIRRGMDHVKWAEMKEVFKTPTLIDAISYCQSHYTEYGFHILNITKYNMPKCKCVICTE